MNDCIRMKPGSSRKPHPSRPSWATYWIFHPMCGNRFFEMMPNAGNSCHSLMSLLLLLLYACVRLRL